MNYYNFENCVEEKKIFFFSTFIILASISFVLILNYLNEISINKKQELITHFVNGNELTCLNQIISIKNGYVLKIQSSSQISDGKNMFNINICKKR